MLLLPMVFGVIGGLFVIGRLLIVLLGLRRLRVAPPSRALGGLWRDRYTWLGLMCFGFASCMLLTSAALYVKSLGSAGLGLVLSALSALGLLEGALAGIMSLGMDGSRRLQPTPGEPPYDA
jgi:hypothetical protein